MIVREENKIILEKENDRRHSGAGFFFQRPVCPN